MTIQRPNIKTIRSIREGTFDASQFVENIPYDVERLRRLNNEPEYTPDFPRMIPKETVVCIDPNDVKPHFKKLEDAVPPLKPLMTKP